MARINIEDTWWMDPRRAELIRILGDEDKADIAALRAWYLSQRFWKQGRRNVPVSLFKLIKNWKSLMRVGLARMVDKDFVYVAGSQENHEWLISRQESGRLGGRKTQEKNSSKLKQAQANSSLFSSSSSNTNTNTREENHNDLERDKIGYLETGEKKTDLKSTIERFKSRGSAGGLDGPPASALSSSQEDKDAPRGKKA